ncbi:hypothetical protein Zmor_004230 [Zophobas morio]|uniref:Exosome complex exonuclease RRP44 S1 domain-containing protein n=1 Tax=Zophobas morio TaxID=2755281 RepID=A0AA38HN02_9CUCU|nr:hypothetical protein Zmor_004230 [Zophobas morio]
MLAAAIDWSSTHPGWHTNYLIKQYVEEVCDNLNKRHRAAQCAARASAALYTTIYFQDKVVEEEAYVIKVCNNAVVLMVPKYGIEGAAFLRNKDHMAAGDTAIPRRESVLRWKPEAAKTLLFYFFTGGKKRLGVFDRCTVQIHVDQSSTQGRQLLFRIVEPVLPGVSVPSLLDGNALFGVDVKKLRKVQ